MLRKVVVGRYHAFYFADRLIECGSSEVEIV